MPQINVNLGDVEDSFENLPVGTYLAEISKAKLREATEEGKFDQLMVTYTVIEGELLGKVSTQWLSFSPKAAFMMKRFFKAFGLEDLADMDFDDDTLELLEPDLVGIQVIFKVTADAKAPGGFRTELASVEDEDPIPAPAPKRAAKPVAKAAAEPEADDEPAADDDDGAVEEEAVAPRRAAPRAAATATKPQRRSLR